jgi:hypothetical protein
MIKFRNLLQEQFSSYQTSVMDAWKEVAHNLSKELDEQKIEWFQSDFSDICENNVLQSLGYKNDGSYYDDKTLSEEAVNMLEKILSTLRELRKTIWIEKKIQANGFLASVVVNEEAQNEINERVTELIKEFSRLKNTNNTL